MAVKTKDIVIDIDTFNQDGLTYKSGQGTAIYFKGKNIDELEAAIGNGTIGLSTDGIDLIMTINGHNIAFLNYIKQNGSNSFKYIKTDELDGSNQLIDIIGSSLVNLPDGLGTVRKGNTITGTNFGDDIDASWIYLTNTVKVKSGNKTITQDVPKEITDAGLTINGANGNDKITGSNYSDTINGAGGNDEITGGTGNDTITGGAGVNIVNFNFSDDGKDKIKLTKGEVLLLSLTDSDYTTLNGVNIDVKYTRKGNDLIISGRHSNDNTLTIANYFTNHKAQVGIRTYIDINNKTGYSDTSLENILSNVKFEYDENDLDKKGNLTTSASSDSIDASDADSYNVKTNKGVTVNAGDGDNEVTGSAHNDVIKAGKGRDTINSSLGDDTITGGAGDNTIVYSGEFDTDTINLTKKENLTLDLSAYGITSLNDTTKLLTNLKGKDLILKVAGKGTIILKNYMSNVLSSLNIKLSAINILNSLTIDNFSLGYTDSDFTINEKKKTATITTSQYSDKIEVIDLDEYSKTIKAGEGNDFINAGKGDDKLTGGKGADTFIFNVGDGVDTITDANNEDTIQIIGDADLHYGKNGNNLEIYYDDTFNENQKIIVQDYFKKKETQRISNLELNGDSVPLANIISNKQYSITGKGTINGTKEGNDDIVGSKFNDTVKVTTGNNTVKAKGGNDNLYGGSANSKSTFIFKPGDGQDIVNSGKGEDTLQFDDVELADITFEQGTGKNNKDLIIRYSDNDFVTVKNLYTVDKKGNITGVNQSNSVKHVVVNGSEVFFGPMQSVLVDNGKNTNILPNSGIEKILIPESSVLKYQKLANNDLVIYFGNKNSSVTLKEYYSKNVMTGCKIMNGDRQINIPDSKPQGLLLFASSDGEDIRTFENDEVSAVYASKNGNEIHADVKNVTVYGSDGNDEMYVYGDEYSTIYPGKGNDSICLYSKYNDDEQSECLMHRLIFNKGDGNDTIVTFNSDTFIKFADSSLSELTYEKYGTALIIKYNKGADSIVIEGYYDGWMSEDAPEYVLNDKDWNEDLLSVLIEGNVQESTDTVIYGANGDDNIRNYNNKNIKTVICGNGNDEASLNLDNAEIYGGNGNDDFYLSGTGNTIWGGKGNDVINCYPNGVDEQTEINPNVMVFNKGDGQDTVYTSLWSEQNNAVIFNFADSSLSELIYEKYGDSLLIKYNSGADSVLIGRYFADDEYEQAPDITIVDKDNMHQSVADIVNNYGTVPESADTILISTTDADEKLNTEGNTNIKEVISASGNDGIYVDVDNVYVNTGAGYDSVSVSATNAIVVGGTGNDNFYSSGMYTQDGTVITNNTFVFNNGDGNDMVSGYYSNITLKFADVVFSDIKLEKYGEALLIKYNSGEDSVAIQSYYADYMQQEDTPNYIIVDKNGISKTLDEIISTYEEIPESTGTQIIGTNGDDYIRSHGNPNITKINGNAGNDKIYASLAANATIDGGLGNDHLQIDGAGCTVIGGKGDDRLYVDSGVLIFNKGDGNDIVSGATSLKFADSEFKDLSFERCGEALIIKYNSGKDSIRLSYYYQEYNDYKPETLIDKYGQEASLSDMLSATVVPESTVTIINGTTENDYINYDTPYVTAIYGYDGDDKIYPNELSGATIDGGNGNDQISAGGTNNIIIGGKGNDIIHVYPNWSEEPSADQSNTLIFNKGDGNDTVDAVNGSNTNYKTILNFADSSLSDLTLEKYGASLKVKYNSGKDSVLLNGYYPANEYSEQPIFNLVDKNGKETSLEEFISTYGAIKESSDTFITGTENADIISTHNNTNITKIYGYDGNDEITTDINNVSIFGGYGSDHIYVNSTDNLIYGEKGNDFFQVYGNTNSDSNEITSENTFVFNKGDGNDIVSIMNSNAILKFTDSVISDMEFEQFGNALKIKYNSGQDSIMLERYFSDESEMEHPVYKIIDKDENTKILDGDINQINQNILSWLKTKELESMQPVLDSGSETNINNLMAQFQAANWQSVV